MTDITAIRVDDEENVVANLTDRLDSDLPVLTTSVHSADVVPLSFAPGEAYQFDWSHEVVLLSGVTVIVKAAHVRLRQRCSEFFGRRLPPI